MRVTIKHVAKVACVSHTTVSRVFHHDLRISKATRLRVLEAAKELNYRPNIMARGLVNRRTYLIGLVVPEIMSSFFPEIIQGIEEIIDKQGYSIILCTTEYNTKREWDHVQSLLNKGVDGLIIFPVYGSALSEMDELIAQDSKPVVYLTRKVENLKGVFVSVNERKIGFQATEHLIKLGHQRIAHLAGDPPIMQSQQRQEGFWDAFRIHKIDSQNALVIPSGYSISAGFESTQELLSHPNRPTAIYAVSDVTAIGAIQALRENDLRVPLDMAVVGTDDLQIAALVEIPLTTIAQPKRQMGKCAAQTVLDLIEGEKRESIELETNLVIRESCGAQLKNGDHIIHPGISRILDSTA